MDKNEIEIVNNCSTKILGMEYFVRRSMEALGCDLFDGISKIVLVDRFQSGSTDQSIAEEAGSCSRDLLRTLGYYYFSTSDKLPYIELYIIEIYRGIPFPLYLSPVMLIRISYVLAHELAHHLVWKKGSEMDDIREEFLADKYAAYCMRTLSRNFWYRFWKYIMTDVSGWHFAIASADYRLNSFEKAENHFYTAWQLNPKSVSAAEWYWHLRRLRSDSKD